MAYITFIADGKEVNVYCGYIKGCAVNTQSNQLIPTQSKPTVVYLGDKLSDKIDLNNITSLSYLDSNGVERSFTKSTKIVKSVPISADIYIQYLKFFFKDPVTPKKHTQYRFYNNYNGLDIYSYTNIEKNNAPCTISDNISSSISLPEDALTPIYTDYMFFQVNNDYIMAMSPTHFTPLNWCNLIRNNEGSTPWDNDYILSALFGTWKFPKKTEKLYTDNDYTPNINGTSLYKGGYISNDGKKSIPAYSAADRGIAWNNYIIYGTPPRNTENNGVNMYYRLFPNMMTDNTMETPPDEEGGNDEGGDGDEDDGTDNIEIPTPPPIFPTNSKLFTLYRLETSQLDQIGGLLWSKEFKDTIFGVNQSPIDAIIDIYALPVTNLNGTTTTVKVGNTQTQINAIVPSKWTYTIDCGNIYIQRYYDDFVDYLAQYQIYLPFIGLRALPTDLTGSTLNVQYIIDLLTGNCTALIYDVQGKTGLSSCLYTYNGNCSYSIPYTGQNLRNQAVKRLSGFSNIVTSAISPQTPYQSAIATANAAIDLGLNEMAMKANVFTEDTGGCASYLNIMKPFIIITRVKKHKNNYPEKLGAMYYSNAVYNELYGFNQIVDPHLAFDNLTDKENEMINDLLERGVIF